MIRNPHTYITEELVGPKAQRADFIKTKMGHLWQGLSGYRNIDDFVEAVAEADPTPKGIYMQWIAKMVLNDPTANKAEDIYRTGDDLRVFEKFKAKIENKDINSYKSFSQLFAAIEPFTVKRPKTKEEKAAEKKEVLLQKVKADITTVYTGANGWIRIPTTMKAAQFLGQSTRWCTAPRNKNMFKHYSESDVLFVIYDKATKSRFQLHIDSGQFMDEKDNDAGGMNGVPQWARQPILDWYQTNNPNLNMKQMITLSGFGKTNMAKGGEHEGLLDLMAQYGVV